MNKKYASLLLLMIICIFLISACQQGDSETLPQIEDPSNQPEAAESDKILIVTGEFKPYTSEDLEKNGFFVQIVEAVLTDAGIACEIDFYPWDRGVEMAQNGEASATFPYSENESRKELFIFSDGIVSCQQHFYYLKSNEKLAQQGQNFTQLNDFSGFTFGGTNGYWYGNKEDVEQKGLAVEWANDNEALFKMLYSGRIDFLIEDERVADMIIEELFPNDVGAFAVLPNTASMHDYHFLISKTDPDAEQLLVKFNASLHKLQNNGEIDRILEENGIDQ